VTLLASPRVFLSYARKDGEEFATALRSRLADEAPDITIWQDRAQMEGGVGWWAQIEAALDRVKFLVIVMTPAAMASEITRREWRGARQRGLVVYPVKGVPDDQLDYTVLPNWMRKSHFFDVGRFAGGEWRDAKEWQTFVTYLRSDRQAARAPFMAPDLPHGFVPRAREFDRLLRLVLDPSRQQPVAITTALHGAGGYGKTTLASALCHDERIVEAFDDGVLWASLGQKPHLVDELTKWYEALTGQHRAFVDVHHAATSLAEKLEHRSCLLVIDDVWDRAHLEPFLEGGSGCARLVTTRRFDLVSDAARVRVDEMSETESVRLLSIAFSPGTIDDARVAPLAGRLGEWPLLLKLAAGMIQKRLDRGDSAAGALTYVERALDKRGVTAFDRTDATQRDEAVRRTIAASLDQLSIEDARHFQALVIVPEETAVPLTTLERLWGLDDLDAADCAQRLDDVSLVALDLRRGVVTLHDVMRAYLLHEPHDAAALHAQLVAGYGDVQRLPDAYAWRWLPYHLRHAGRNDELRALLLRPAWLSAKVNAVGPNVDDFDLVRGDPDLEMVQAALRLSLPAVTADASQFWPQLLARIPSGFSERLDGFIRDLKRAAPRPRLHARWSNLDAPGSSLVQTLVGHQNHVSGALVLPDGRVFSWSGARQDLRIWNLATGERRLLRGHKAWVDGARLLSDGQVLTWSGDRTLRLWNLSTGEARVLSGHGKRINGALLLSDARALSWSDDQTIRIWDLESGEGRALAGHTGPVSGALPLSDGRVLSWSDDQTLRVWDLATGESRALTGHADRVNGALRLPDGRALSWSRDGTLRTWDLATADGDVLIGHEREVLGALLMPDARVLSWSHDNTLRIWDPATGTHLVLRGHDFWVTGALALPDGRALSWARDHTLRIWNLATGESRALVSHEKMVHGALMLPDGRALSWSEDATLRVLDLTTSESRTLVGHEQGVLGALVLPDGRLLSWSFDRTMRVWDLAASERRTPADERSAPSGALLVADARALSWSRDHVLRVWDLRTGDGRDLVGHESAVRGVLSLPNDRALSWSDDHSLRVWNLAMPEEERVLTGHEGPVRGALVLADQRLLSWSDDRTLRVWHLRTGEVRALIGHERAVTGALPLPGGRRLLSWAQDQTLRLWSLESDEGLVAIRRGMVVTGALLLPDDRTLSWGDGETLWLFDLATGEKLPLTGHSALVHGALLLPGGRALSWSRDRTLWVWDLASREGRELAGHKGAVHGALSLPDGRVVSWANDRTVRVWNLDEGAHRTLITHTDFIYGALLMPDGCALSWSRDRSIRLRHVDGRDEGLAFYFDATPTVVLPDGSGGLLVCDALGRVHFLQIEERSEAITAGYR
jgi:WD40 repeat protein